MRARRASSAEQAGIPIGATIVGVNASGVADKEQLLQELAALPTHSGSEATFKVLSGVPVAAAAAKSDAPAALDMSVEVEQPQTEAVAAGERATFRMLEIILDKTVSSFETSAWDGSQVESGSLFGLSQVQREMRFASANVDGVWLESGTELMLSEHYSWPKTLVAEAFP